MGKKITIILALLVILVLAVFIDSKFGSKKQIQEEQPVQEEEEFATPLVVKHQYKDGKHIFMGDIETPTPCYELETSVDGLSVNINSKQTSEVCAEVIDTKTFRVEIEAPENAEFKFYVNGELRRLNSFDLAPNVDIEQFELFIKG